MIKCPTFSTQFHDVDTIEVHPNESSRISGHQSGMGTRNMRRWGSIIIPPPLFKGNCAEMHEMQVFNYIAVEFSEALPKIFE